jgi:ribonuclease HI
LVELVINIQEPNAKGWLNEVINAVPQDELTRVIVTLWAIWHARRKALHEEIFQSPLSTLSFIDRFIGDLGLLSAPPKTKQRAVEAPRWIAPPAGVVKVNVDAALSKNGTLAAVAAVARDGDGEFIGASTVTSTGISDPEIMEAMACREGLALASDLNLQHVRLASDCASAVHAIRIGVVMGRYGQLVHEIKETQSVVCVHESRRSNTDAHNLARGSIHSSVGRHVWLQSPPVGVPVNILS